MNSFDQYIYNFIVSIFSISNTKTILFFKLATTLGSTIVICTVIFSLFLLFKDKKYFFHVAIASFLGVILESLLKIIIKKPRPTEFWPLTSETTYSFPSGHSFMSMLVFGMIIYFIIKEVKNKKIRYLSVSIFSLIIFIVGLSRIYLGVHYPTDVVGGYILALIYLIAYIKLVIERKDRKDKKLKKGLNKSKQKQKSL